MMKQTFLLTAGLDMVSIDIFNNLHILKHDEGTDDFGQLHTG